MKVITESIRAYEIRYLRFYYCSWFYCYYLILVLTVSSVIGHISFYYMQRSGTFSILLFSIGLQTSETLHKMRLIAECFNTH